MSTERVRPAGVAGTMYPIGAAPAEEPLHHPGVTHTTISSGQALPNAQLAAKARKEVPKEVLEDLKNTIWLTEGDEIFNLHDGDGSVIHLVVRKDGTMYYGKKAGLNKAFSEAKTRLATKSGRIGLVLDKDGLIKKVVVAVKHGGDSKPKGG